METPSSARRVTRSQSIFSINNAESKIPFSINKTEDSGICRSKKIRGQEDRSALIDITNDSPIVGLAMQTTPPSGFVSKKQNSRIKSTPGSGEALLRGQVKTLLQKVEEGTELIHSINTLPFIHLVTSPMRLLVPTPANTPQFSSFSHDDEVQIKIASPVVAGYLRTSQVSCFNGTLKASGIFEEKEEEEHWSVSRSLLPEFTDMSTLWGEGEVDDDYDDDKLCEGMKKMSMAATSQAEFAGTHTRFVYSSDDEEILEAEEVLHLKGIPTPKGKHFRFATEEDKEEYSH